MSIIISKKINMLLINFQKSDNIKTTKCLLNSLIPTWWWWWCNKLVIWEVCPSLEEWVLWELWEYKVEEPLITKGTLKKTTTKIKDSNNTEDKLNKLNLNPLNKPLGPPLLKKWPFKVLKIILVNSLKWKKKNKVPF